VTRSSIGKQQREADRAAQRMGDRHDDGKISVYLGNATRTSGGSGPGMVRVPPDEAARLVAARLAIYGDRAPRGLADGGGTGLAR
jgi:hypothetical protein